MIPDRFMLHPLKVNFHLSPGPPFGEDVTVAQYMEDLDQHLRGMSVQARMEPRLPEAQSKITTGSTSKFLMLCFWKTRHARCEMIKNGCASGASPNSSLVRLKSANVRMSSRR